MVAPVFIYCGNALARIFLIQNWVSVGQALTAIVFFSFFFFVCLFVCLFLCLWREKHRLSIPTARGEVYSVQKTLRRCAANMGSKISSLLVYEWPLIKPRICYMNGWIFENCLKFIKIWSKIWLISIWMSHFFLKNWYFYGSTFKFRGGTSLSKPNLSTSAPPPGGTDWGLFWFCLWLKSRKTIKLDMQTHYEHYMGSRTRLTRV